MSRFSGYLRPVGAMGAAAAVAIAAAIPAAVEVDGTPAVDMVAEVVVVDARSMASTRTVTSLVAGKTYTLEVEGEWQWGLGAADAECSTQLPDTEWVRTRYPEPVLDLTLDGMNLEWEPVTPDANGCNTTDHRYRASLTLPFTQQIAFRVDEGPSTNFADNSGYLVVRIIDAEVAEAVGGATDTASAVVDEVTATTTTTTTLEIGEVPPVDPGDLDPGTEPGEDPDPGPIAQAVAAAVEEQIDDAGDPGSDAPGLDDVSDAVGPGLPPQEDPTLPDVPDEGDGGGDDGGNGGGTGNNDNDDDPDPAPRQNPAGGVTPETTDPEAAAGEPGPSAAGAVSAASPGPSGSGGARTAVAGATQSAGDGAMTPVASDETEFYAVDVPERRQAETRPAPDPATPLRTTPHSRTGLALAGIMVLLVTAAAGLGAVRRFRTDRAYRAYRYR